MTEKPRTNSARFPRRAAIAAVVVAFSILAVSAKEFFVRAVPAPSSGTGSHHGNIPWPAVRERVVGNLPVPGMGIALSVSSGRVYQAGGFSGGAFQSVVQQIWPQVRPWSSLPQREHDAAAGFIGHTLYVFGGGQDVSYSSVVAVQAGKSAVAGQLGTPLSDAVCLPFVESGRAGLLIIGGYDGSRYRAFAQFVTLTGGKLTWRRAFAMPEGGLRYVAVARGGTTVYLAGGLGRNKPSSAVYQWMYGEVRPRFIARLPRPLYQAAAWAVPGYLIVVGGVDAAGVAQAAIYAVNLTTRQVRTVGALARPLGDMGYAPVGKSLLLAGGWSGPSGQAVSTILQLTRKD